MPTMKKKILKKKWACIECIMSLGWFFHRWMSCDENTLYRSIAQFWAFRYSHVSKRRYRSRGWVHRDTSSWRERSCSNGPICIYPPCQCRSIPSKQSNDSSSYKSSLKIEDGFALQISQSLLCEGWMVVVIFRLHWSHEEKEEELYLRI